ncbi:hypothetical protein DFH06DRAFT_1151155 [Mycena polygramma]|nr:hypothetical protein DFH06DRAFT_1151155 [Mycena polygramma]
MEYFTLGEGSTIQEGKGLKNDAPPERVKRDRTAKSIKATAREIKITRKDHPRSDLDSNKDLRLLGNTQQRRITDCATGPITSQQQKGFESVTPHPGIEPGYPPKRLLSKDRKRVRTLRHGTVAKSQAISREKGKGSGKFPEHESNVQPRKDKGITRTRYQPLREVDYNQYSKISDHAPKRRRAHAQPTTRSNKGRGRAAKYRTDQEKQGADFDENIHFATWNGLRPPRKIRNARRNAEIRMGCTKTRSGGGYGPRAQALCRSGRVVLCPAGWRPHPHEKPARTRLRRSETRIIRLPLRAHALRTRSTRRKHDERTSKRPFERQDEEAAELPTLGYDRTRERGTYALRSQFLRDKRAQRRKMRQLFREKGLYCERRASSRSDFGTAGKAASAPSAAPPGAAPPDAAPPGAAPPDAATHPAATYAAARPYQLIYSALLVIFWARPAGITSNLWADPIW